MTEPRRPRFRVYDTAGRAVRVQKRYLWLVVVGLAAVTAAFLFIPFYVTTTPGFCSNCHIMEPFIHSWEDSTHSKFGCHSCHVRPGLVNGLVNQVVVSKNVYLNFIGRAEMPEQIRSATNLNCLQGGCHSVNRRASTSGDLLIPHREHVQLRNLQCKDCHYNVVHTSEGGTPVPPMGVCAMCHDGRQAANECSTCHERNKTAEGVHPEKLALDEHADIARGRVQDCVRCHKNDESFCAQSGCHDLAEFRDATGADRLEQRFVQP
jgi:nitrate/TMAO reductase-like tetraheme cytochrome c subunit